MPIDAAKMLSDVPGSLHVTVTGADGVDADGVLTYTSETRGANDYGYPALERDTVYVATPFSTPRGRITVTRDGVSTVRRVESVTDNVVFLAIGLGEELHE